MAIMFRDLSAGVESGSEPAKLYRHHIVFDMNGINDTRGSSATLRLSIISSRSEPITNYEEFAQTFAYTTAVPEFEGGGIETVDFISYNGSIELGDLFNESHIFKPCTFIFASGSRVSNYNQLYFHLFYEGATVSDEYGNFETYGSSIISQVFDRVAEI